VLFGLTLFLVQVRQQPSAARGADAPATEFSAARSAAVLRTLVGDGSPHPVGSPANDRVRERILAELRRLGYSPEVQEGTWCGRMCARLHNVVARLDGTSPGKAVLLMAHYDSVPAGPGVGDDMSGVAAVLEVARALKSGPPLKNPVIFLLNEGEEMGLFGAELFVARHPAARDVGVVVNLEARGTAGPSLMFETSGDDAWMVDLYSSAAPHPVTSSVYATIYDLLPNDTDLTVFKRTQVNGLNFAFVKNPNFYHTPQDSVENLSTASLQHHGDNALAAARALGQADLASPPKGDAVFFDVLSLGVVRWPKGWTPVLAILALVLAAVAAMRALRRPLDPDRLPGRALLFGLLGFWGAAVAALLLSAGLFMLLRGAMPYTWVDRPQAEVVAFWVLGIGVALLLAGAVARRAGAVGLWSAVWIGWSVLGVVVAMAAPGISYLFVVPALAAGILGLLLAPERPAASLVPALLAALLWMPILIPLYDGLGAPALVGIGLLAAVLATSLAPLVPGSGALGRRWIPLAAFAVAVVCAGLAFASAPYSKDTPQPLPFQFVQDDGQARWLAFGGRPLPPAVRQAVSFPQERERAYSWGPPGLRAFVAAAPRLDVPGPQVSVLDDSTAQGTRTLRLLLTSNRGAREAGLLVPEAAKLTSATVDGEPVPIHPDAPPPGGFRTIGSLTMRPEGVEIVLRLGETQPQEWRVYDVSDGLPPSGEALLRARPASAVPYQDGDTTVIERKVKI
jgi:MFS family permease